MKGATMYEYQFFFNRIYLRFLRPRFWNRRSWPWIRLTICDKDGNIPNPQDKTAAFRRISLFRQAKRKAKHERVH